MSFKRREVTKVIQLSGTRPSRSTSSVSTVSTGIPSLDDILGGGLPLGSVLVLLTPDPHTAYAELVQRYFLAQGIASGQNVCILDKHAMELASGCMWVSSANTAPQNAMKGDEETAEHETQSGVKIAWRYENMKKFRTSVTHTESTEDAYCQPLDLTCRIPEYFLNKAITSKQLRCFSPVITDPVNSAMIQLDGALSEIEQNSNVPIRLSIPSLGSPQWGDLLPSDILRLFHFLRARLRQNFSTAPRTCTLITMPFHLSGDDWGGPGWSQKLGWLSDGCITLQSFSSDPALSAMFPSHHGLVTIHTLPSPHALISASDKFSELRGLSTFASSATGGGENNLAFKCTRKRFIIETLHLDVEGGISERRTTATVMPDAGHRVHKEPRAVQVETLTGSEVNPVSKKKPKKSVAFRSDRPDLYDF